MELRVARHTGRPEEVVRFNRDGLGQPEIGRFENHDGYARDPVPGGARDHARGP